VNTCRTADVRQKLRGRIGEFENSSVGEFRGGIFMGEGASEGENLLEEGWTVGNFGGFEGTRSQHHIKGEERGGKSNRGSKEEANEKHGMMSLRTQRKKNTYQLEKERENVTDLGK